MIRRYEKYRQIQMALIKASSMIAEPTEAVPARYKTYSEEIRKALAIRDLKSTPMLLTYFYLALLVFNIFITNL